VPHSAAPKRTGRQHLNERPPAFRRELEATYASFRRFLVTVQAVVVKRLQE
jgi:hypothetical protein